LYSISQYELIILIDYISQNKYYAMEAQRGLRQPGGINTDAAVLENSREK